MTSVYNSRENFSDINIDESIKVSEIKKNAILTVNVCQRIFESRTNCFYMRQKQEILKHTQCHVSLCEYGYSPVSPARPYHAIRLNPAPHNTTHTHTQRT